MTNLNEAIQTVMEAKSFSNVCQRLQADPRITKELKRREGAFNSQVVSLHGETPRHYDLRSPVSMSSGHPKLNDAYISLLRIKNLFGYGGSIVDDRSMLQTYSHRGHFDPLEPITDEKYEQLVKSIVK